MATIVSQSELVRKAAEYINEKRNLDPNKDIHALLDEAGMRFNLTPLDQASLERIFSEK
ncbi:MAG: hypothetical protein IJU76_07135 [Desulfovibrionaceae bacterium]|nr:hypothetical protein [Desulfovibrionaceae bacterium]